MDAEVWMPYLIFTLVDGEGDFAPRFVFFEMLRMKRAIQICAQNWNKILTQLPGLLTPCGLGSRTDLNSPPARCCSQQDCAHASGCEYQCNVTAAATRQQTDQRKNISFQRTTGRNTPKDSVVLQWDAYRRMCALRWGDLRRL